MISKIRTEESGFSLVELLVYVLLASLVLAVGANIVGAVYRAQTKVVADSGQSANLQSAFASMAFAFRNANKVQLGTATGGYLLNVRVASSQNTYPHGSDICRDYLVFPNALVSGQPQSYALYTKDFALNSGVALTVSSPSGWTNLVPAIYKDSAADPVLVAPTVTAVTGGSVYGTTLSYALPNSPTLKGVQRFFTRVIPSTALVGTC